MSQFSQNGWPASPDQNAIDVHNYDVPGTHLRHFKVCKLAAPVLLAFAAEYHKIQPIDAGTWDEWGYNFAKIPNSTDVSNHASGTAIDVNATLHPWKSTKSGFSWLKQIKIRLLVRKYGLRWGFDYAHGWKDPMHFEVVETKAQVAARIKKMKLPMPTLSR
jgi:hypothetical protein